MRGQRSSKRTRSTPPPSALRLGGPYKRMRAAAPASTTTVFLPEDIVTEILLLLPAKSLARFRCVCRSWNAQIGSRGFQQKHHGRIPPKLAFVPMAPEPCISHFPRCRGCPRLVCPRPCRGLVLLERRCFGYFSVCNLSTGGVLHLPRPPLVNIIDDDVHCAGIGFDASTGQYKVVNLRINCVGVARVNVITLTMDDASVPGATGVWRTPGLLASGAGQSFLDDDWRSPLASAIGDDRLILANDPACTRIFVDKHVSPVFAGGCLHWMFRTDEWRYDEPHGILSFSLADESFRRAPQPYFSTVDLLPRSDYTANILSYKQRRHERPEFGYTSSGDKVIMPLGRALAELNGSLCMVRDVRRCRCRNDVRGQRLFEIWKLQDYKGGSWSMDYSINSSSLAGQEEDIVEQQLTKPRLVVPICYIGTGSSRKMVLLTSAHKAHVYDPDTNDLQTVADFSGEAAKEPSPELLRFVLYQQSLVHLDDMEHGLGEIKFVELM